MISRPKGTALVLAETSKIKDLIRIARQYIEQGDYSRAYRLLREKGQFVSGYQRDGVLLELISLCGEKGKGRITSLKDTWHVKEL